MTTESIAKAVGIFDSKNPGASIRKILDPSANITPAVGDVG